MFILKVEGTRHHTVCSSAPKRAGASWAGLAVRFGETAPLKYVPQAALGAVLVMAAYSLVDITAVRRLWGEDRGEFAISIIATLSVVAIGSVDAILFAVVLALLRFVRIVARPTCEVLGEPPGMPQYRVSRDNPTRKPFPASPQGSNCC